MNRPLVLTIAGSDSGGGAGIQMDLRVMWALGCYGASAITCITSQNLDGVNRVDAMAPETVSAQIKSVSRGFRVQAVKTGMLFSEPIIRAVVLAYDQFLSGVPWVVDPVMVATSGARLLRDDAIKAYGDLFHRATVITPNLDELEVLSGERPQNAAELETTARTLFDRFGSAVLAKGGHLEGPAVDVLVTRAGAKRWSSERIEGVNTHGSGCAFASAITAGLASGHALAESVERAKRWLDEALQNSAEVETTRGEVRLIDGLNPVSRGQEIRG